MIEFRVTGIENHHIQIFRKLDYIYAQLEKLCFIYATHKRSCFRSIAYFISKALFSNRWFSQLPAWAYLLSSSFFHREFSYEHHLPCHQATFSVSLGFQIGALLSVCDLWIRCIYSLAMISFTLVAESFWLTVQFYYYGERVCINFERWKFCLVTIVFV